MERSLKARLAIRELGRMMSYWPELNFSRLPTAEVDHCLPHTVRQPADTLMHGSLAPETPPINDDLGQAYGAGSYSNSSRDRPSTIGRMVTYERGQRWKPCGREPARNDTLFERDVSGAEAIWNPSIRVRYRSRIPAEHVRLYACHSTVTMWARRPRARTNNWSCGDLVRDPALVIHPGRRLGLWPQYYPFGRTSA